MSAPRALLRTATLAARTARPVLASSSRAAPTLVPRPTTTSASLSAVRLLSVSAPRFDRYNPVANDKRWANADKVTYDELKPLTDSPSDKVLLIGASLSLTAAPCPRTAS